MLMHVLFEDNARYSGLSERLGMFRVFGNGPYFSQALCEREPCATYAAVRLARKGGCDWCACVPDPMMRTGRLEGLAVVLPEAADMFASMTLQLFAPDLMMISREPLDLALFVAADFRGGGGDWPLLTCSIRTRLPLSQPHAYQPLTCAPSHFGALYLPRSPSNKLLELLPDRRQAAPLRTTIRAAHPVPPRLSPISHTHKDGIAPGILSAFLAPPPGRTLANM
jgi:hypothetical protein